MAKLARATGTYWCWGGEGIWRVGSKLGAVVAAEGRLSGEGGAGTYRTYTTTTAFCDTLAAADFSVMLKQRQGLL